MDILTYINSLNSPGLVDFYIKLVNSPTKDFKKDQSNVHFLIGLIESLRVNPNELEIDEIIFCVPTFRFVKVEKILEHGIELSGSTVDYNGLVYSRNYNTFKKRENVPLPKSLINMRFIKVGNINNFLFSLNDIRSGIYFPSDKKMIDLKLKTLLEQH